MAEIIPHMALAHVKLRGKSVHIKFFKFKKGPFHSILGSRHIFENPMYIFGSKYHILRTTNLNQPFFL